MRLETALADLAKRAGGLGEAGVRGAGGHHLGGWAFRVSELGRPQGAGPAHAGHPPGWEEGRLPPTPPRRAACRAGGEQPRAGPGRPGVLVSGDQGKAWLSQDRVCSGGLTATHAGSVSGCLCGVSERGQGAQQCAPKWAGGRRREGGRSPGVGGPRRPTTSSALKAAMPCPDAPRAHSVSRVPPSQDSAPRRQLTLAFMPPTPGALSQAGI